MPGNVIGSAYVEIRPKIDQFEQSLKTGVGNALGAIRSQGSVPVRPDVSGFESALAPAHSALSRLATAAAGIFVADKIKNTLTSAFDDASSKQLAEVRAKSIFGAQNEQVQKFLEANHKGFVETSKDAELAAVSFGNYFQFTGASAEQTAKFAEGLTGLAGRMSLLHPELDGIEQATTAITRAMETGSSKSIRPYGIQFTDAQVKARALALGLVDVKENTDKIKVSADELHISQNKLAELQSGKADPAKVAVAQLRLADAQARARHELQLHGAASIDYKRALAGQEQAQIALNAAQNAGKGTPDQILAAQDEVIKKQNALATATKGVADNLTEEAKAQAIASLLLTETGNLTTQFNAALETSSGKSAEAKVAWQESLGKLGDQIMPKVTEELTRFTNYLNSHQDDIAKIGKTVAGAIDDIGKFLGFLVSHKTIVEDFGVALAGIWVYDHTKRYVTGIAEVIQKIRGIPKLPGLGGGAVGTLNIEAGVVNVNGKGGFPGAPGGSPIGGAAGEAEKEGGSIAKSFIKVIAVASVGAFIGEEFTKNVLHTGSFGDTFDVVTKGKVGGDQSPLAHLAYDAKRLKQDVLFGGGDAPSRELLTGPGRELVNKDALEGNAAEIANFANFIRENHLGDDIAKGYEDLALQVDADVKHATNRLSKGPIQSALDALHHAFGGLGGSLGAGVGAGLLEVPHFAGGGFLRSPQTIVAGDVQGGEAILNTPEIRALIAAARQGGNGDRAGFHIDQITIHNPAKEADVISAFQRAARIEELASARGFVPARSMPETL